MMMMVMTISGMWMYRCYKSTLSLFCVLVTRDLTKDIGKMYRLIHWKEFGKQTEAICCFQAPRAAVYVLCGVFVSCG